MTRDELLAAVAQFPNWYHKIDLGQGVVTPGHDFDPLWAMIRDTRRSIDYSGKKVLDLASFDGMWAFEAEQLAAELVVATDCYYETFKNFLFCHRVLNSNVVPYYNISPYDLSDRLDVFLQEAWAEEERPYDRLFDVVQHLGLLYHLRDPMLSLGQARSVLRDGGYLLIETAAVVNHDAAFMLFNGVPPDRPRIYDDITTWWAPTIPCLRDMLRAALFEPLDDTIHVLSHSSVASSAVASVKRYVRGKRFTISRVCLVAQAIGPERADADYVKELSRTYRNPGLVLNLHG